MDGIYSDSKHMTTMENFYEDSYFLMECFSYNILIKKGGYILTWTCL